MKKHSHDINKNLITRMSKIVGHSNSIKTMIEDQRDCTEILIQIAAVRSALNSVGKILLNDHINHCVKDAIQDDQENLDDYLSDIMNSLDKYIK